MPGPVISMPPSLSPMFDIVKDDSGEVVSMTLRQDWAALFQSLQDASLAATRYGTTSQRPTYQMQRYIGMPYFDTDLGLPVFLETATRFASTDVWVDATGAPA